MAGRRRGARRWLAGALLLWAALPAGAFAEGPQQARRIYVLAVPASEEARPAAAQVGGAAREALRELPMADWQEADRLFLGYDEGSLEALRRARAALEEGRQAYMNLELDKAIESLTGALSDFELARPVIEDATPLYETLLLLGASYTFQGMERQAREVFRRLHVQFPGRAPDPNVYPPDVVQRYERAAPRGRAARPASIRIETDPPGALVYFDYVPMGRSPLELADVVPGAHVVRLLRPGAQAFVQEVTLRPGRLEESTTILTDAEEAQGLADAVSALDEADFSGFSAPEALTEVIGILGVEQVAVLRVDAGAEATEASVELLIYGGNGRRLLRAEGSVPLEQPGLGQAVGQMLEQSFQRTLVTRQARDEERVFAPAPPPPEEPALYERWWFWAAVGGAAVAAGGVAAFLATRGETPTDATVVLDLQR